jgi:hypothetical protein
MRVRGASLTKTDGKIDEYVVRHLGMGQKLSNIHCLVDKTMNMCESYLTKTYLKISGASSCRCIGIAGYLRYNEGALPKFLEKPWLFDKLKWGRGIRYTKIPSLP